MKPRRTRVKRRTNQTSMNCANGSRRNKNRTNKNRAKPRRKTKTRMRYGGTHEDMNNRQFEYTTTFLPTN